jgi:hypothetical protein
MARRKRIKPLDFKEIFSVADMTANYVSEELHEFR